MRIIPAKMEGLVLQATTPTRVGAWLDSQATDVKVVGILKLYVYSRYCYISFWFIKYLIHLAKTFLLG